MLTPATQGSAWEGFLRSLQGDLMGLIGFIVFLVVVLLVVRWLTRKAENEKNMETDEALAIRKWAGRIVLVLCLLAVVATGWRAFSFASANRLPRADIDRTGTYEKMDALTKRPTR